MNEKRRNRKISYEKELLNLYIRYMRNYVKDENYKNLKALKEEDKIKIKFFKHTKPISKYYMNEHNKIKEDYENETDGRKKKTKKKKLDDSKSKLDRFKEIKSMVDCNWLFDMTWKDAEVIILREDDYIIKIDEVEIYSSDIHQFDFDYHTIADFFQLDTLSNKNEKTILTIFRHKALEYLEEHQMHNKLSVFKRYCEKIDSAIFRLKKNSYYKQSAQKALEKEPIGTNVYWLLNTMKKCEKKYGKKLTLKKEHLKSLLLHDLFNKWIDLETSKSIIKNSSL